MSMPALTIVERQHIDNGPWSSKRSPAFGLMFDALEDLNTRPPAARLGRQLPPLARQKLLALSE